MKRKIKKGPGKARQMPVKDLHHVVTTYRGCGYVTAGKKYPALADDRGANIFNIIDDLGRRITAPIKNTSAHLHDIGTWQHPFK